MEKKQRFARVIKVICFLLVFGILLAGTSYALMDKTGAEMIVPYYREEPDSLDVLFFGSSHIMCSIYPLTLWEQYGIASYDCCTSAQILPQTYFQLKDALNTQHPSLVVLDVSGVYYGDILLGDKSYVHTQLDHMHSLSVRLEAIRTLIPPEEQLEYYFPIVAFHSRWTDVEAADFQKIDNLTKGAKAYTTPIAQFINYEKAQPEQKEPIAAIPEEYLRKCIEYCQQRGIDVLLLNTPSNVDTAAQRRFNAVEDIAEEYGIRYLNLLHCYDEMAFEPSTDLHDSNHCSVSGAKKVMDYVASVILQEYDVPTHTGEAAYAQWDIDAAEFRTQTPGL